MNNPSRIMTRSLMSIVTVIPLDVWELYTSSIRGGNTSARAVLLMAPTSDMNSPRFGIDSASTTVRWTLKTYIIEATDYSCQLLYCYVCTTNAMRNIKLKFSLLLERQAGANHEVLTRKHDQSRPVTQLLCYGRRLRKPLPQTGPRDTHRYVELKRIGKQHR